MPGLRPATAAYLVAANYESGANSRASNSFGVLAYSDLGDSMSAGISMTMKLDDNGSLERIRRAIRLTIAPRPLLEATGKMLVTSAHHRFETATGPDGQPWKPIAESTRRARAGRLTTRSKRGIATSAMAALSGRTGYEPRFVTGRSERSITYHATETSLDVGSNYKFPKGEKSALAIHELGGKAGRGDSVTIPARPSLGVSREDEAAMGALAELYFGRI
jgi:phage gpG-like protein